VKLFAAAALFLALPCVLCAQTVFELPLEDESDAEQWIISASAQNSQNGKYLVLLHDLGGSKEEWTKFSAQANEAGYGTLAVDLRGHGASANIKPYGEFVKTGQDNEFNKMYKDVALMARWLNDKGFANGDIYLVGAGLGANVACLTVKELKNKDKNTEDFAGLVLLTASLKTRGVLSIPGLREFKNPVFIAVSAQERKAAIEANILRNAAYLSSGDGKVAFSVAYDLRGAAMLDKYLIPDLLQWLKTPSLPEIIADEDPELEAMEENLIIVHSGEE
jgi:pimeloyl-ACP methyl ester carboxylesterase